jgi:dienelactone hydrolase
VLAATLAAGCGAVAPHAVDQGGGRELVSQVYRPPGDGPFPAVVVMHGCGGVAPNAAAWAGRLRAEGYVALVLDSFTSRGLKRICGDATVLPARTRAEDAYTAAASLKRLPYVAGDRIAVMGFSHGGATTLWAARSETQHDVKIRAFIALYPGCGDLGELPGTGPVLMLLGGSDDWAPPAPCQRLAALASGRGRAVQEVTYPDARHAFDAANLRGRVHVPDARRGQGATVEYHPAAHADAERRIRDFLARYLR